MNHFWTILKASGRFKDNVQICRDVLVFFHDKQSCKCKNLTVGSLTYENDVLKMLHARTAYFLPVIYLNVAISLQRKRTMDGVRRLLSKKMINFPIK